MIKIGQRFGKWTVVERLARKPNGTLIFRCRCDCGVEGEVQRRNLENGRSTSCGCARMIGPRSESRRLSLIKNYFRSSGRRRGIPYQLSDAVLSKLVELPCHYCGAPPSLSIRREQLVITFQGLDRMDSNQGYLDGNVVPCCPSCNIRKGGRSYEEFLSTTTPASTVHP